MEYPHRFDRSLSRWIPAEVHAQMLDANNSPVPLNPGFDVADGPGSDWIKTNKLLIDGKCLIKNGNAAQFNATLSPLITLEEVLAHQYVCPLNVTLYPLYASLPATGLPAGALAVKRTCTVRVSLPVYLETKLEKVPDDEAYFVCARLVYILPTSPATAQRAQSSIQIKPETDRLEAVNQPPRGVWKVSRVKPRYGKEFTAADQLVKVTAQVMSETLSEHLTLPFAMQGRLEIQFSPVPSIKLNGVDSVQVHAFPIFREPQNWDALKTAIVLRTLEIHLDNAGKTCLEPPVKTILQDRVVWSLTAKDAGQLPPGTQAAGQAMVTVDGKIGSEPVEAQASLELKSDTDYELCAAVDGRDEATVLFDKKSTPPGWAFPDITLHFSRSRDNLPAQVGFSYGQPTLSDDQGIFNFDVTQTSPKPSWRVKTSLKDPDLDRKPGQRWLEEQGLACVSVSVKQQGGEGKEFHQELRYHLRPQVEIALYDCTLNGTWSEKKGHSYQNFEFQPLEFAADGLDILFVNVIVRRSDWPEDDSRTLDYAEFDPPQLGEPGAAEFQLEQIDSSQFSLKSIQALLRTRFRLERNGLTLHLTGRLKPDTPPNFLGVEYSADCTLLPQYPFIQLWVIPGRRRGTSTACAFTGLDLPAHAEVERQLDGLQAMTLQLDVQDRGGNLALAGNEPDTRTTGADGRCIWSLKYSGLTWKNYTHSKKVRCRFADAEQAVCFTIDIRANGARLFADLSNERGALQLDNPESWGPLFSTVFLGFKGPFYNLRNIWYSRHTTIPATDPLGRYVCGEYRARILTWLLNRRHGVRAADTALIMNGIECMQYVIGILHDFCGIYLSGSGPNDDPLLIDPWWEQTWNERVMGLKREIALAVSFVSLAASGVVLASYALYLMIRAISYIAPVWLTSLAGFIRDWLVRCCTHLPEGVRNFLRVPTEREVIGTTSGLLALITGGIYEFCGATVDIVNDFDGWDVYRHCDEQRTFNQLADQSRSAGPIPAVRDWESWS